MQDFRYTRLITSTVLFEGWEEIETILRRKTGTLEDNSFELKIHSNDIHESKKGNGFFLFKGFFSYYKGSLFAPNSYSNHYHPYYRKNDFDKGERARALELRLKLKEKLRWMVENHKSASSGMFSSIKDNFDAPFKRMDIYKYTFPMLSMNAAIIEGTLREFLARYMQFELARLQDNNTINTTDKFYAKLLKLKLINIESVSGYAKILTEYSDLFNLKKGDILEKEILDIVESLFTLRNTIAHGTSFVTTNNEVDDKYFAKWQEKVKSLQKVLEKQFGSDDIYLNLADCRLPNFYFNASVIYLNGFKKVLESYDTVSKEVIDSMKIFNKINSVASIERFYWDLNTGR